MPKFSLLFSFLVASSIVATHVYADALLTASPMETELSESVCSIIRIGLKGKIYDLCVGDGKVNKATALDTAVEIFPGVDGTLLIDGVKYEVIVDSSGGVTVREL